MQLSVEELRYLSVPGQKEVRKLRFKGEVFRAREWNLHESSERATTQPFFSLVIEQFTRAEKCKTLIG